MAIAIEREKPTIGSIWKMGGVAAGVAAGVNAVLYFVTAVFGAFPEAVVVPNTGQPITVVPVILSSVIGAIGGTLIYTILSRFLPRATTNRVFTIIALVLLVLSFSTPFTIPGVPITMLIVLEIMHIVVAAPVMYFLVRS